MNPFPRFLCTLLAAAVVLPVVCPGAVTADDPAVATALRAAALGKATLVENVARGRLTEERLANTPARDRLAENIAVLGAATRRPLEPASAWKARLRGFSRDASVRSADRLVRRVEPRQRFLEARSDRRYERLRNAWNGVAVPVAAAVQGQFFPLVTLPFRAAENLVVGRRFLTPEQRRELVTARQARDAFPEDTRLAGRTRQIAAEWPAKRRNLSALQAKQNAEKSLRAGDLLTAQFWVRRRAEALPEDTPPGRTSERLAAALRALGEARRDSLRALPAAPADSGEAAEGTTLLRALLLADGAALEAAAKRLREAHQESSLHDDALAARAAVAHAAGDEALAGATMRGLAEAFPASPWGPRATAVLAMPRYSPEAEMRRAADAIAERKRNYLLAGDPPQLAMRALTPEEARLRRAAWIDRAQALFLTDVLARALFLPLLPPFPKPELPDAAARVDQEWLETKEGRRWLRRVADAQRDEKRHEAAARTFERLGQPKKAAASRQRAAKALERQAEESLRAGAAVELYERLLRSCPDYRRRARVERALADRRAEAEALVAVTREEVRAWPELREALGVPETLVDRRRHNGELSREGLLILRRPAWSYRDRASDERREVATDASARDRAAALAEPLRRTAAVRKEVGKPLPRKRVPLAVEAGMLPGFDVSPGLVPLEPDPAERELFQ